MAVVVTIGTQMANGRVKHLCKIDRFHLGGKTPKGEWFAVLHARPKAWAKAHRMTYKLRIISQWEVEMEIDDPRLATLFKLTWL
jgi:hypothetical protein